LVLRVFMILLLSVEEENHIFVSLLLFMLKLFISSFIVFWINVAHGDMSYSLSEEMKRGSVIGNIAKDLGLQTGALSTRRARIDTEGTDKRYCDINLEHGELIVAERIDREELCGKKPSCILKQELVLENPLELHRISLHVQDVNDNSPQFNEKLISLEIHESAVKGARFVIEEASDADVGQNSVQQYSLEKNNNFILAANGNTVELVLDKELDREKQKEINLLLTALDGGSPQRSGTVGIHVTVLDANDNAPVFSQAVYKANLPENSPIGTVVTTVSATDADEGVNGDVTYDFGHVSENVKNVFGLDHKTGDLKLISEIDFETVSNYDLRIKAKDGLGLSSYTKVTVHVTDVNDNSPVIYVKSLANPIAENVTPGTEVGIINVQDDKDSGRNGQVHLTIEENLPFKIKSSLRNYYTLATEQILDRERHSKYNITLTATDEGVPALSSTKVLGLEVTDVNDNAPAFIKDNYISQVMENNPPGVSLLQVHAKDPDLGQNARISYYLIDSEINGNPASTYFSVNTESGDIQSLRSFDYEQLKEYKIRVKAQDGGSPSLRSNTTVIIRVQDQNDNPPQVLYPVQTGGSMVAEMVPRSADVGYLVTKVVAVDVDSGQNAWLSYKLQKATDRALFEVGLQNGEIRTIRQVTDKDAVKQRLTVIVEDNGQPSRSATVIVNVAVADSFPEVLSEFTDFPHDKEYNDNLTFYLVLALAVVSFLFITCLVVIISVKIYRWRQSRILYHSSLPVIPYYPPRYSDTMGTGTLPHVYNYEVCRTTDSRKSDCKFGGAGSQNVLLMD
uniref:Protocadherin 1 gamma 14 n=1 Tax=Poecilia formosa TaxID=48698 RepID=A0A096LZP6_POEFO